MFTQRMAATTDGKREGDGRKKNVEILNAHRPILSFFCSKLQIEIDGRQTRKKTKATTDEIIICNKFVYE